MEYTQDFKYDEVSVFTQDGILYAMPVWAFQSRTGSQADAATENFMYNEFLRWADTRKFPLLSNVQIPEGVYSAYLFKVYNDPVKFFGIDISHYEYKGNSPLKEADKFPSSLAECPFDETVPAPSPEHETSLQLARSIQAKCAQMESMINHRSIASRNFRENSALLKQELIRLPEYRMN